MNKTFSRLLALTAQGLLPLLPAAALCAGTPASAPVSAPAAAPAYPEPGHFSWTGKIAAGKTLTVRNDYGDIRARFGGYDGKVEVAAVLQHLTGKKPPLQVQATEQDGAITLTVGYPAASGSSPRPASGAAPSASMPAATPPAAIRDRADLVIFVPKGTPLDAQTQSGVIEAKGLQGDVSARSGKGNLFFRTDGRVEARSERGAITAYLDPAEKRPQRLETLTGDLIVTLRDNADVSIEAATSGEISTDFSLQMQRNPHEEPDKRAIVKVGKGGAKLTIESKRGNIKLLWLPAAPENGGADND